MANQVEVAKIVEHPVLGAPSASAVSSKLIMYVVGYPSSAGDTSNKQGHTRGQIIVRGS